MYSDICTLNILFNKKIYNKLKIKGVLFPAQYFLGYIGKNKTKCILLTYVNEHYTYSTRVELNNSMVDHKLISQAVRQQLRESTVQLNLGWTLNFAQNLSINCKDRLRCFRARTTNKRNSGRVVYLLHLSTPPK